MAETKIPSIYRVPSKIDPELKRYLESVQEAVEVRLGRRGDELDQAVTFRDLIDSRIAGRGSGLRVNLTPVVENPTPSMPFNTVPQNVQASGAFTKIMVTWDNHQMGSLFARAEIWRAGVDDLNAATLQASVYGSVWTDTVDYNTTMYYWVRFVQKATEVGGVETFGAFSDPAASATTAEDVGAVMTALSEELSDLPGYTALTTVIDVDIAAARLAAIAGAAFIIRATSAPSVRDTSPTTPLQPYDIWVDTDDNNQMYIRNTANNAWVEARDGTLVNLVDAHAVTISGHTSSIASAVSDIAVVTGAQTATATAVTALTATVDTKAQTFAQDGEPADNSSNALLDGDLWIDTNDSNKLYRWDGDSWEEMIDPSTSGISVYAQDAEPSGGTYIEGDLWFDTDDGNKQYRYNGSAWVAIDDTRISSTSTALTNLTATVTGTGGHASQLTSLNSTIAVKNQTFVQASAPTALAIGDLWVDSDDGNKLYRASATGTGNWVAIRDTTIADAQTTANTAVTNAAGAQGTADGKVTTFFQADIPGTDVKEGDLWIDSDDNKLYRAAADDADQIAAGEWIEVQDNAIATAISDAADAQSTADGKIVTFYQTSAPTATSVGDLWVDTDDGNKLYRSSATGTGNWVAVGADTNTTFAQDTAPGSSGLITGDLWVDTDSVPVNKLYRWDGDSWEGIEDGRLTLNATAVENLSTAVGLTEASSSKITALETTVNHATTGVAANAGAISTLNATVNVKTRTFAQNGEPANPYDPSGENYVLRAGDLWIDTNDENKMYRWTGSVWFGLPPSRVKTFVAAPTPAAENVGDLWFNSSDDYFLKRATATGTGDWVAVADARIASTAELVEALRASVGKVYGARIITTNASNNVKVETMANVASSTTTATHGISADDVTAGVFISLKNAVATGGLTTQQLNKTFKVTARVNTTQLQIETVGDAATSAATSVTVVDGGTIGANAGFTQLATVTADMQGNAQAAYVLQVNANGEVGGMVIEANSSASGDDSGVAVQFSADKFAIWNGTSSSTVRDFVANGTNVDTTNNTILLDVADYNAFYNTTAVTYHNGGGTSIGGLTSDTVYYVIKGTSPKIQLALTETLATAGTAISLSSTGSGTHTVNNVTTAPFIVSNGNVYIDTVRIQDAAIVGAKIADATIETAHIIDLNADKIRAGNLNASARITVGSDGTGATDQRIEINPEYNRIVVVDDST